MHITLESDYAIRIVACLARSHKRMDAKAISESTNVTLRFALKILRKLVASGIVKSFKGTQGGYEIDKAPVDITLCDVIETVEGPYYFSRCLGDTYSCSIEHSTSACCAFQEAFNDITATVRGMMKSYTFDKLI